MITDLHASAGQEGDAATKVCQFGSLVEIELCTRRTHLIVEMMNGRELLFADVAVLRIQRFRVFLRTFSLVKIRRRKDIGACEHGLPSKSPNPRRIEDGIDASRA